MMYSKYSIRSSRALWALLAMIPLFISSCKRDEQPRSLEERSATMNLFIPKTELRGGILYSGEDQLEKVRVLVFKGSGIDVQKLFKANEDDFNNPFHLTAHEGDRTIYVIANESSTLGSKLSKIAHEKDLKALLADPTNTTLTPPFIFTGHNTAHLRSDQTTTVDVDLHRIVAKITLSLRQESPQAGDQLQIKKVTFSRMASSAGLLAPLSPFTLNNPWSHTYTKDLNLTNNAPEVPYISDANTLYVYENIGSASDSLNRAPMLRIEALYNNIPTTYTAYINDNSSDADHHYAIHRNHHYDIKGVITKLGDFSSLLLTTNVLPWSVEELSHHFLEPEASKIIPASIFEGTNYCSQTQPFEITIRLKATPGSKWHATLTNGLEFGFTTDTETSGNADNKTDYTIKIRPLKAPGYKPHKTDFYLTIDGKEVILKKKEDGSRVTRITIIQKANV